MCEMFSSREAHQRLRVLLGDGYVGILYLARIKIPGSQKEGTYSE